jgi:hypothetical protein
MLYYIKARVGRLSGKILKIIILFYSVSNFSVNLDLFSYNSNNNEGAYEWKMFYDESDNILIRGLRNIHEKFSEAKGCFI